MKSIETKIGRVIIGRVMPDEDLIDAISEIVKKHQVKSGLITVIGALKKVTIGYFNLIDKNYQFKTFDENVELVSCMGNISYKNGNPIIHLHVTIGLDNLEIKGGHLSQPSIVSITAEVYIHEVNKILTREHESMFNADLLRLE